MSVFSKKRNDNSTAWYYRFQYNGRRYCEVGGTTKTEAIRAQEKRRAEVLSGDSDFTKTKDITIAEFSEKFLQRREDHASHNRDVILVNHLVRRFKGRMLSSIYCEDVEDYKSWRKAQEVSNATVNRELACLKRMYNLGIKWGNAKRNPVVGVDFLKEPPGRTRFLSIDESQNLIACCIDHLKPIVMTALNTGMRLEEILSLTWTQVHIEAVIDPYLEILKTKNNKARFVPLNNDMVELLRELKSNNTDSRYVFKGTRSGRLHSVRNIFETALKRAGILDFRFHDLRHTFASHFIMTGGDPITLKEILGHSSLKMVERYPHLAEAHKRRQINNLTGLFTECHLYGTSAKVVKMGGNVSS